MFAWIFYNFLLLSGIICAPIVDKYILSSIQHASGQQISVTFLNNSHISHETTILHYNNSFLTYQNKSTLGISIQYPSSWKKIEADDKALIFLPPSKKDSFSEKLTVAVFSVNSSVSTGQLSNKAINNYGEQLIDFFIIDSKPITFGGKSGYLLSYTYSAPYAGTIAAMDIGFKDLNKAYVISYSAQQPEYHTFVAAVEKMVESFHVMAA